MQNYKQGSNEISPELAAQIVKNYILPMFESDEKRALKNKYNKLSSISNATGSKVKGMFNAAAGGELKSLQEGPNSVYGELKLSEKLADELRLQRD